jgi:hypothetical protein
MIGGSPGECKPKKEEERALLISRLDDSGPFPIDGDQKHPDTERVEEAAGKEEEIEADRMPMSFFGALTRSSG